MAKRRRFTPQFKAEIVIEVLIPFRLNNSAYSSYQLYHYDTPHTNCCPSHQTRRRGSSERIVSAIEIFLPRRLCAETRLLTPLYTRFFT